MAHPSVASWEGACAGQGNPCTIKGTGSMDVTAVLEGQYVPPAPPKPAAPSAPRVAVNPSLTVETSGLSGTLTGTGYHPNSSISIDVEWSSPAGFSGSGSTTSDASGSWSLGFTENCIFDGPYSGPVVFTVTATDAEGASASDGGSMTCP